MRTKSQIGWLPAQPPPVTVKQRAVIISHEPEEGADSYEGKVFEKRNVLRRECKTPRERSTSGPGSEYDDGEELGDDEGSN